MTEEEKAAQLQALLAERNRRQQAAQQPVPAAPSLPVAQTPASAPATQAPAAPPATPQASALSPAGAAALSAALAGGEDGGLTTNQDRAVDFAFAIDDRTREAQERLIREAEEAEKEAHSESVANFALETALNPESDPDNIASLLQSPELQAYSANERIDALSRIDALNDGALSSLINPEVEPDTISQSAAEAYRAREDARIANSLQSRLLREAQDFSGDPVNALIRELEIGRDGETPRNFDRLDLDRRINALATEYGIPPEHVAVAMQESFIRDPGGEGIGDNGIWPNFLTDWQRNTLDNRFPEEDIRSFIDTNLSTEAIQAHYNQVRANQENQRQLAGLQSELSDYRLRAERYEQLGQPVPQELLTAIGDRQARIRTFGQVPEPSPEAEPQRDTTPQGQVSDDRMREAYMYSNNYFKSAGITPYLIQMQQNPNLREETLARIQAHIQNDQSLTDDQKNVLWAVANE